MAVAALALQFQLEGDLLVDHIQQGLLQLRTVIHAQALQQLGHVAHRQRLAEDAGRLVGQVQTLQAPVPFPAADVRQRLRAVEQGVVALEFGDVAEQAEHVVRRIAPIAVHRHVGGGDPDHPAARAMVQADDGAAHDAPGLQRDAGRPLFAGERVAVLVHADPVLRRQHRLQAAAVAGDTEDAVGGRVGGNHPQLAVKQDHALVDGLHQQPIARLGLPAAAQIARYGHDAVVALMLEPGRMHFHREAAAVAAHVGDFDDVGFALAQRLPDRVQMIAGEVRVQQLDRLADDLFAWAAIRAHPRLVEIQYYAVLAEDADRIGNRIEQRGVATQGQLAFVHGFLQGLLGRFEQVMQLAG
ncbi:hypothetical protein D3C71_1163330 [compost metagenome]